MIRKQEEHIEETVNYFAISLFGQNTEDEILWDLARNCISRLGFEDCVIYLVDDDRRVLVQKAAYGPKNPKGFTIHDPLEIPLGAGIVGSVALSGKAELVHDTSKDPRYIKDDAFRYSELCVPIMVEDKVIGVIDSEHTVRNFFTLSDLKALRLIASLCANKLMRARAEREKHDHARKLRMTQQELARLSLKALRAQMNPHFIFNALNAIQYFVTEKQSEEALKYLSLFGRFLRKTLDSSNHSFLPLATEIDILESYLSLEKMRFPQRFEFEISVQPSIVPHNVEIPVLLIQPMVEYAFTEGARNRREPAFLRISFEEYTGGIVCKIRYTDTETLAARRDGEYATPSWSGIQERIDMINDLFDVGIKAVFTGTDNDVSLPIEQDRGLSKHS